MKQTFVILALSALTLTACGLVEVEYEQPKENISEIINDAPIRETKNVTYTGVLQPAGISIYNQGTHRLVLPGGKFVLLEGESLDLNGYVGEEVQIFGALRPTVEAGGLIMRVERIELVAKEEEVQAKEDVSIEFEDAVVPADEDEINDSQNAIDSVDEVAAETQDTEEADSDQQNRIEAMARQDFSEVNWTQQYCTSHISFCAPVHRNWWFKSFGATSSTLWRVELSSEPIESLGQGPLVIELVAGSIGDGDGTIVTTGRETVGYKEWTFGRHFRISGDKSLVDAIAYITKNITDYAN